MLKKLYYRIHRVWSRPDERGEYSGGYWQDKVRKEALRLCEGVRGRILEIGCGEGLFLLQLAKANPSLELWGVDNSQERLNRAQEKAKSAGVTSVRFLCQEAPDIRFEEGYFDAVICINVFFNMPSFVMVRDTIRQMKHVSKKTGKIIFDFRNARNPLLWCKYRLARLYDETVKDLPLRTYTRSEIKTLLRELNFSIEKERASGFPWLPLAPLIVIKAKQNET